MGLGEGAEIAWVAVAGGKAAEKWGARNAECEVRSAIERDSRYRRCALEAGESANPPTARENPRKVAKPGVVHALRLSKPWLRWLVSRKQETCGPAGCFSEDEG